MKNHFSFGFSGWCILFLSSIVLVSILDAKAQRFTQLSVNEGLAHSDANGIGQDHDGLIWVATTNGLNRYNGFGFSTFRQSNDEKNSFLDNKLRNLFIDSQNRIWMTGKDYPLFYFDPITNQSHSVDVSISSIDFIQQFREGNDGSLWILTKSGVLGKVAKVGQGFKFTSLKTPGVEVLDMIVLGNNEILLASKNGLYKTKGGVLVPDNLDKPISKLLKKDRQIFAAGIDGVYQKSDNHTWQKILKYDLDWEHRVKDIKLDYQSRFWLAKLSDGFVSYQRTGTGEYKELYQIDESNSGIPFRIRSLFIDQSDLLWILTGGGGLFTLDLREKPFQLFNIENSNLKHDQVMSFEEFQGQILVGTRNGISAVNEDFDISLDAKISQLASLDENRLMIGTLQSGCYVYDNEELVKLDLPMDIVNIMATRDRQYIWVATYTHGIFILDFRTLETVATLATDDGLPTNWLTYLYQDPKYQDIIWIGTYNQGLVKLTTNNGNKIQSIESFKFDPTDESSISSDYVWSILRTKKGTLWVATMGEGLNEITEKDGRLQFRRIKERDGLAGNEIESMLEDDQGYLWLGGRGLVRFDPLTDKAVTYDYADGLQSNSFKVGAVFKDSEGYLYFGGVNGYNKFRSSDIQENPKQPTVIFDKLFVHNKLVEVGKQYDGFEILSQSLSSSGSIIIHPQFKEFSIELVSPTYANPKKNQYAYLLDGINQDWIYLDASQRRLNFANLKPGTYQLRAKVSNADNLWGEESRLDIVILAPWYATGYAFLTYALVLFGLLYVYSFLIVRKNRLEKDLAIADKEKSLNDERLELFTNISHEIRSPLTLITGPLEEMKEHGLAIPNFDEKFNMMYQNAERLLKLTNQLLDFSQFEKGKVSLNFVEQDLVRFLDEVMLLFSIAIEKNQIKFSFTKNVDTLPFSFDADKFEILITNLLSNAIKFTPQGGEISLSLTLADGKVRIEVSDSGKGIKEQDLARVFDRYYQVKGSQSAIGTGIGLALVKNIVEVHQGTIVVKSEYDQGTHFIMEFPYLDRPRLQGKQTVNHMLDADVILEDEMEGEVPGVAAFTDEDKKYTILLVEDNRDIMSFLSTLLESSYHVIKAEDGRQGVEKALKHLPDIIISDVMMPNMSGVEMLAQLKSNNDVNFIPVILLTGRTASVYELEGISKGAHDYIKKPFRPKVLVGKINNIIKTREYLKKYYQNNVSGDNSELDLLPNSDRVFVDKITKLVLDNLKNEQFSVQMLSQEMGMSQSSCYKRLKDLTGLTAVQFIRDQRLIQAESLFRKGEKNVLAVSMAVGINDEKYFRDKFKSKFGDTPKKYALKVNTRSEDSSEES